MPASWAVVGGGFLGMSLALRLAQQNKRVTLFEGAAKLGGLAAGWQLGDITWDRFYHVILSTDSHLRALLREMDMDGELQWNCTRTGFYIDSQLHSMSSTLEFLRFPPLNLYEKVRLAATIVRASRSYDEKSLDQIPVDEWLEQWSGKSVTEKIWRPLLRAKLGEEYRRASAAFITNTIARMYGARSSGAKTELFGYMPGGYERIIRRFQQLLKRHGVDIRLGCPIQSVTRQPSGKLRIELSDGQAECFSKVVLTTPTCVAAEMCADLTRVEKENLTGISYQGIICASLLLKEPLSPFYITNITDKLVPFTAVIEMSALVDRKEFGGKSLVYLPKYLSPKSPYFLLTDHEIREDFLTSLALMYPRFRRDDLLCIQLSRVKHLLPIPTINYSAKIPKMLTSIPGLHLVNSTQIVDGTLNINETVRLAESAAKVLGRQKSASNPTRLQLEHEFATAHS